jgi:hypothetical protein
VNMARSFDEPGARAVASGVFRVPLPNLRWKYETSNIILELLMSHMWRTGRC